MNGHKAVYANYARDLLYHTIDKVYIFLFDRKVKIMMQCQIFISIYYEYKFYKETTVNLLTD